MRNHELRAKKKRHRAMKSAFHSDLKATPPLLKNVLYQYMAPNILSGKTHLVKVFKAPGPTNLLENYSAVATTFRI
jgi:hypothetical protein